MSGGNVIKTGGVVRAGTIRVGLPSEAGKWNQSLNDQTVDFDRDAFTRFIADKGYEVTWEKSVFCPNVGGLSPRDHVLNCQLCDHGLGFLYIDPVETRMLMQGIKLNQSFFAYGRWDMGNMLVTAEPEFNINFGDRLTLSNGVARFPERVVRTKGSTSDKLKYEPLSIDHISWVGRDGSLVVIDPTEVTIVDDTIVWAGTQPDAGSFYSISYMYRPRYVVMDLIHHHRDSTIAGTHYQFPVQAVAKLDFLIRDESKDAPQTVDENPFPR